MNDIPLLWKRLKIVPRLLYVFSTIYSKILEILKNNDFLLHDFVLTSIENFWQ